MYVLQTLDEQEKIIGHFYSHELSKCNEDFYRISKVLQTKKGKSFVSWRGYPQRYNSWIPNSSIKKIKKP